MVTNLHNNMETLYFFKIQPGWIVCYAAAAYGNFTLNNAVLRSVGRS